MACPYFQPAGTLHDGEWLAPPRQPLGDAHRGVCRAGGGSFEPAPDTLRSFCNRGYARYGCRRFPPGAADAVRFALASDRDGRLEVLFIHERDYSPVDAGRLVFSERTREWSPPVDDPIVRSQAEAFVESYLKRRVTR